MSNCHLTFAIEYLAVKRNKVVVTYKDASKTDALVRLGMDEIQYKRVSLHACDLRILCITHVTSGHGSYHANGIFIKYITCQRKNK